MHRAVGLVTSVVAAFAGLVGAGAAALPAQAATPPAMMRPPASLVDTVDAAANFVWVNTLRVASGAPPVVVQSWASGVAQTHSLDMANQGSLFHNITGYIDLGHTAMSAVYLGENVAEGTNLSYAQAALQASPPHMAILLDPRYNYVGVGAATDASGQVWVTEDFAQITGGGLPPDTQATTAAAKPAAPAPAPKPAVIAAPKPAAATPSKPTAVTAPKPVAVTPPKPALVATTATAPAAAPSAPPSAAANPAAPAPSTPAGTQAASSSAAGQAHAEEPAHELASHRTQESSAAALLYATLVLIGVVFALGLGFQVTKLLPR